MNMCECCKALERIALDTNEKQIDGLTPRCYAKIIEVLESDKGGYIRWKTSYKPCELNYCPECGKEFGLNVEVKKMTVKDILKLIDPEWKENDEEVVLVGKDSSDKITVAMNSVFLTDDILNMPVVSIDAEDNKVQIWMESEEE